MPTTVVAANIDFDNFDQELAVLPEVALTHGKLVHAMMLCGRRNISVHVLNTMMCE